MCERERGRERVFLWKATVCVWPVAELAVGWAGLQPVSFFSYIVLDLFNFDFFGKFIFGSVLNLVENIILFF